MKLLLRYGLVGDNQSDMRCLLLDDFGVLNREDDCWGVEVDEKRTSFAEILEILNKDHF